VRLSAPRRRVLLIGDSFTEGLGLEYTKSFAGLVADGLRDVAEVLNAGVTSYSPAIYFAKIRHLLEDVGLEFHDVVVFLDVSDVADEAQEYELLADGTVKPRDWTLPRTWEGASGPLPAIKAAMRSNSVVVRLLDTVKDRLAEPCAGVRHGTRCWDARKLRRAIWTIDEASYREYGEPGLHLARQNMTALAELVERHSISLTIVVYPWPDQIRYDSVESIQVVAWREWARANDASFIDLFPPFFADPDAEAVIAANFITGDMHFNERGSQLVARSFLEGFQLPSR
jgi:hypothetical protein